MWPHGLKTATGTRAFVKAVGPELNPESPGIHRAEARIAAALPEGTPAPRLLGFFDEDGWVVLVFEDIEGAPPVLPWEAAERPACSMLWPSSRWP